MRCFYCQKPLTADEDEWMEVTDGTLQNRRVSHVFWEKQLDPLPYTIDGKAFSDDGGKSYFTNRDSRVYFALPGYPPKTEYVLVGDSK